MQIYKYINDLKNYLWTCQKCTPLSDVFYFCWHIRTIFIRLFPETPLKESVIKSWIIFWIKGKVAYYLLSKPEHVRKQGGTISNCARTAVKSLHHPEQTKPVFALQGRGSTFHVTPSGNSEVLVFMWFNSTFGSRRFWPEILSTFIMCFKCISGPVDLPLCAHDSSDGNECHAMGFAATVWMVLSFLFLLGLQTVYS